MRQPLQPAEWPYPLPRPGEGPAAGGSLQEERQIMSVANLTRVDATDLIAVAGKARVVTSTTPYPLEQANKALSDLGAGRVHAAAVLVC